MLITKEDLDQLWKHITEGSMNGTCSIMIFIANNCDAMCAYKILSDLLRQAGIQYSSLPVFSYAEIDEHLSEDKLSTDIRSLIFLNCGAKIDFTSQWFSQSEEPPKVFVFESQRPISHNNVLTQKAVYVVDFGDISVEDCPEDDDIKAFDEQMEAEGEDSIPDGEKEYQLLTKNNHEEDKSVDEDEIDEDYLDKEVIGKKRKRSEDQTGEVKVMTKQKRLDRVNNYYSGNSFSKCCAYLMYSLGEQLNKQTTDSFWLWILGLTDQLVHSKITPVDYDSEFDNVCLTNFMSIANQDYDQENNPHVNNVSQEDPNANLGKKFDSKGLLYQNVELDTENLKVGTITPSKELKFMFLRNWSLYESVFYSNYVVCKLKLWQELGKRELNTFFAQLGIPQEEYKQQYKFMNPKFKKILIEKLPEIAPRFDIEHVLFNSFVRQIDNKTQMNAADMVYAITSILE